MKFFRIETELQVINVIAENEKEADLVVEDTIISRVELEESQAKLIMVEGGMATLYEVAQGCVSTVGYPE